MQTQLLCTFTSKDELQGCLQKIRETYYLVYNYIYVLQNKSNLEELFITYNIDTQYKPTYPLRDTILVHRKKQSNTIYTINALNEVIKSKTGGMLDNSYMIDWDEFRNCIITTSNMWYKKIPTKVFKSFNTNDLEF